MLTFIRVNHGTKPLPHFTGQMQSATDSLLDGPDTANVVRYVIEGDKNVKSLDVYKNYDVWYKQAYGDIQNIELIETPSLEKQREIGCIISGLDGSIVANPGQNYLFIEYLTRQMSEETKSEFLKAINMDMGVNAHRCSRPVEDLETETFSSTGPKR